MAAEESEKRFEAVMEKLFQQHPPQILSNPNDSSSSSSAARNAYGVEWLKGRKRLNVLSKGSAIQEFQNTSGLGGSGQAPPCRPWDRDDLFRRLATFKSMTWFAKPQAVSAVNCARRGWINIDMDIISCESCGARLLFSTPSSWAQQQVEKAALVFSLKLDTGHKLLCPWVDNICDEKLAQFPPKPTTVSVEDYKKRCSALLQLSALPIISPSAIEYIRSPQLEQFLGGPSSVEKNKSADAFRSHINEPHSASSASYYQAQKLISLCGWEPHSLPYIVDCKFAKEESSKSVNLVNQSHIASNGLTLSVVCSSPIGIVDANDSQVSERALSEPNSVVLDCSLCGASVGLWAFSSVSRPIEFLRLVGYTELDENDASRSKDDASGNFFSGNENRDDCIKAMNTGFAASTSSYEKTSSLNLTIAGGPPPAKQSYRATISLPVVGRILRARISIDSIVGKDQELSLVEGNTAQHENQVGEPDSNNDNQLQNMQVIAGGLVNDDNLVRNVGSTEPLDSIVGDCNRSQIGEFPSSNVEDNAATVKGTVSDDLPGDRQSDNVVECGMQAVDGNIGHSSLGRNPEQVSLHKSMEFDPIRQHRLFCPWIASSSNSASGWQQTLSALQRHKEFSHSIAENTPSSLIEVDDPIASVRKLFSSPPAKRTKHAHAS
ncbi:hypothetical protein ACH5RR_025022 [Cinchona calisaya]|uniref:C3HC-type domain-containing protein n=1 Tax=Cinchona calisaya TaxID=153742 RepID=A0ABD2Z1W5_9GENT